jgi:hypothetical protein
MNSYSMMRAVILATALAIPAISVATPAAAGPFDGSWSVVVSTHRGNCDPSFRTSVYISNGVVSGTGAANVAGRVSNSGAVSVSVSSSAGRAHGSGRLRGNNGGGSWSGSGQQGTCSGSWSASRGG